MLSRFRRPRRRRIDLEIAFPRRARGVFRAHPLEDQRAVETCFGELGVDAQRTVRGGQRLRIERSAPGVRRRGIVRGGEIAPRARLVRRALGRIAETRECVEGPLRKQEGHAGRVLRVGRLLLAGAIHQFAGHSIELETRRVRRDTACARRPAPWRPCETAGDARLDDARGARRERDQSVHRRGPEAEHCRNRQQRENRGRGKPIRPGATRCLLGRVSLECGRVRAGDFQDPHARCARRQVIEDRT